MESGARPCMRSSWRSRAARLKRRRSARTARVNWRATKNRGSSPCFRNCPRPPTGRSIRKRCARASRRQIPHPKKRKPTRELARHHGNGSLCMSYVRITEFTGLGPAPRDGEWYTVDGREGSVRLERGEAALDAASAGEGHVATRWTGVRIYHRETAPIVYML